MTYRLIMCARRIPTGATVTRITGTKKYKIYRSIRVDGEIKISSFTGGAVLIAAKGESEYSAISGDEELLWYIEGPQLLEVLTIDGYENS